MAVAALKVWALKNRPRNGNRVITEPEILEQTQYAYDRNYRGYGCESAAVSAFCQPGLSGQKCQQSKIKQSKAKLREVTNDPADRR
jgi:hypothetical protein